MTISEQAAARKFPPFSLARLLRGTFAPAPGQRVCVLIDLERPEDIKGFAFLTNPDLPIQRNAHMFIYEGLKNGVLAELGLEGGEIFAYQITGGSNLDLPGKAVAPDGKEVSLERDVYPNYDIILCVSTYSATAPLTAFAKKFGFRGATLHGLNQIILSSGLSVDYDEVSVDAEKLRLGMTRSRLIFCMRAKPTRSTWTSAGRRRRRAMACVAGRSPMWRTCRPERFILCRPGRRASSR